ncbi:Succinate-semialdehyde dehydrogenase [Pseudomonas savastanoi pv. phaseolicola]|uniref:Succinate-semialdehyde dehydrogenase n=2 Tax=Pseudomonas savastanoi TaxID=29438 RepID=A0A3M3FJ78_PSESG|nr:Succinate-semialdehyde dehydrogenase [Pseudomonas savastanoi pv. phaseolicola]KPB68577.1 Succinate-semialdehyde dehydrogenase [Pseudomonas amygdali pv. mellea]RMM61958.1 Succinate-semialdehyde dehydrogenase [Pseudomonas savastanoi pv. glycinea]KPB44790.1 Succinate-semialdehyde dehydrogenase [Pseudomonas savastanoi pv. phaseolicola]KPB58565.1 Succinate-semialdehyde dehydrogenase [Pseudomonas savastanoi pv. phaseolicola]
MLKNQLKDPSLLVDRAYVDGQWISADNGATLTISDPATGDRRNDRAGSGPEWP